MPNNKNNQPKYIYGKENPNYKGPQKASGDSVESHLIASEGLSPTLGNNRGNKKPQNKNKKHGNINKRNAGITKKGQVSKTDGQVKRHYTSMTEDEQERILEKVCDLYDDNGGKLMLSNHLKKKGSCNFTQKEYEDVMDYGNLIEVNQTKTGEYRALVRGPDTEAHIDGKPTTGNLCTVVCIKEATHNPDGWKTAKAGEIVTAYWNKSSDNHSGYNKKRYDNSLELPEF